MKVSVLLPTYGRYALLRKSVAFFHLQSHKDKELIILNDAMIPVQVQGDNITVLNLAPQPNLGVIWNRLVAEANGELCQLWNDDDWYLPWHIEMSCAHMLTPIHGWKPTRSWVHMQRKGTFSLGGNRFEASATLRAAALRNMPFPTQYGDEQPSVFDKLVERHDDLGGLASYVYLWDSGVYHASGAVGTKSGEDNQKDFKSSNRDFGDGEPLDPDFDGARECFRQLVSAAPTILGDYDLKLLKGELNENLQSRA